MIKLSIAVFFASFIAVSIPLHAKLVDCRDVASAQMC